VSGWRSVANGVNSGKGKLEVTDAVVGCAMVAKNQESVGMSLQKFKIRFCCKLSLESLNGNVENSFLLGCLKLLLGCLNGNVVLLGCLNNGNLILLQY
jgi:hypothetical protein